MKRSKTALEGGRPRRPRRQRTIGLESLERRELLATLDVTFGSGGRTLASITTPGATNATYGAVTAQPDGKYIVVGTATNVAGNRDFAIARLNADGSTDSTFNRGAGAKLVGFDLGGGASGANDDIATGVAVQPDGKIVVAGTAGGSYIALTRLLPNGDFDLTFEDDGKVNTNRIATSLPDRAVLNTVSVAIQNVAPYAGNIVVAAGNFVLQFSGLNGTQLSSANSNLNPDYFSLSRITFTGNTFDPGTPFGPGLASDTFINDMVIDPLSGKIVVVGAGVIDPAPGDTFLPPGMGFTGMGIARLNPDGSNDFTFGDEVNYQPYIPDPTLPDATTGIDSNRTDDNTFIPRYSFSLINTSNVSTSVANGVALGPNGTIFVVGTESQGNRTAGTEGRMLLVKLTSGRTFRGDNRYGFHPFSGTREGFINVDGVLDTSFTANGVFPIEGIAKGLDVAYDAVDDKVVAIGYVNLAAPTRQEFAIIRTDRNGIIDTDFASSFGTTQDSRFQTVGVSQVPGADLAQDVVLLPDGRIVVAGTSSNGTTSAIGLLRLLTDEPPTFSIGDMTVTEGDSGTVNAVFTVTLSAAYRVPISVNVSTAGGSAGAGTDFGSPTPTTLTFAPGQTSLTVSVPVISDFLDEPDETFTVSLSNPILGTILDGLAVGTIVDNDPPHPTITIGDTTVTEGHSGTVDAVFTVTLSRPFQLPISVDVSTANGTGIAGTDFVGLTNQRVTFAPGETSRTVTVSVISNMRDEPDRTFFVNLSNTDLGVLGADTQGVGTILDDEGPPPTISISDATVTEGSSGPVTAEFTVSLSYAYLHPISVNLSTANGTALFGADFGLLTPTTVTFAPGQTSLTVSVPIVSDLVDEDNETFTVNLSNPFLGTILDGQGVGTISNDDPRPPTISISDATVTEARDGSINAAFTVSLSAAYINPITVALSTANGTALFGADFALLSATSLTFAPGDTILTVSVPVFPDGLAEGAETFFVNLSNPSLGTILDGQGVGTIVDLPPDVTPPVVLSVTPLRTGGGGRRGRRPRIAGFEVQFNEALDPSSAQNFDNYILNELRRGPGRLGRPRRLGLREARYDPIRNVVTLVAAGQPRFQRGALLSVSTGVTDRAGNGLDGNSDGTPGPAGLFFV